MILFQEVEYRSGSTAGETKKDSTELDQNHTHFILVDDGSVGEYGVEIDFRAELESKLQEERRYDHDRNSFDETDRTEKIPMILIVVQGGPRTLETVVKSINKDVPVLVLAESKGCADLIANASKLRDKR